MILATAVWFLLIAAVAAFPTLSLRRRRLATRLDDLYPFGGVVTWIALTLFDIGATASLSNFVVEVFWVALLSAVIPWIRWILTRWSREAPRGVPVFLALLPVLVAVALRMTMPTLPE